MGCLVGAAVGEQEGAIVGGAVGTLVGGTVGVAVVGEKVGIAVGDIVGFGQHVVATCTRNISVHLVETSAVRDAEFDVPTPEYVVGFVCQAQS